VKYGLAVGKLLEVVGPSTAGYKTVSRRGSQLLQPISFRTFVNISYCNLALFIWQSIRLGKASVSSRFAV
jgi:hypothetical protein